MDNVFNSFSIHYIKSNVKAWTYNMAAVEANTRYLFETYESSRRICMDWTYYIVALQQGFSNCASRHLSASWYSPKGISQNGTLIWVTHLYFFYLSLAKRVESVKGVEVQGGWWCMEVGMVGTPILTIHCYSLLILISQWLAEQKNQIQSWFMSYNCSWANLHQSRSCRFTGDTPVGACRSVIKFWNPCPTVYSRQVFGGQPFTRCQDLFCRLAIHVNTTNAYQLRSSCLISFIKRRWTWN